MSEANEVLIDVARSFWTANDKAERLQKEVDRLRAVNAKLVKALEGITESANDLLNEMVANPARQGNWGGLAAHVQIARTVLAAVRENSHG